MVDQDRRTEADESMAPRLTRAMRATTSLYGMYTDPPIVALGTAITTTAALALGVQPNSPIPLPALAVFALLPVLGAVVVALTLLGARDKLVDWLASLPFAVVNMNGLLHGVGDRLCVRFQETRPDRDELNAALEAVHEDCFVLEFEGDDDLEVELKIGVLDSKWNPSRAAYRRFCRVQEMVARVLTPVAGEHPITDVRIC